MAEIGAFEARNRLGSLLDRVQNGEEIIITRHGQPAAPLVPFMGNIDRAAANAAADRILARAMRLKAGRFRWGRTKPTGTWVASRPRNRNSCCGTGL